MVAPKGINALSTHLQRKPEGGEEPECVDPAQGPAAQRAKCPVKWYNDCVLRNAWFKEEIESPTII